LTSSSTSSFMFTICSKISKPQSWQKKYLSQHNSYLTLLKGANVHDIWPT
jgi:hypothetical protein